ncbi:MAG: hypothetical protein LC647_14695, partial [Beggiatoa sp.]|nr:hypothetical protein [Beggiatoa sp.]
VWSGVYDTVRVGRDQRAGLPRYHGPAIEGAAAPHHATRQVRLGDAGERDFDRPLAKRGQRDAPHMGEWLRAQGLVPDLVLASPARRAREAEFLAVGWLLRPPGR